MLRALAILSLLFAACQGSAPSLAADGGPVAVPRDGGASDAGAPEDGGEADGGAASDAGVDEDGGVDPVCLRRPESMTFFTEVAVVEQDLMIAGSVLSVDRENLVLDVGDGGLRTVRWTLPTLAAPPLLPGMRIRLLYRPYSLGILQAAVIAIWDADANEVLFVGDTGLHHTRIRPEELEVVSIGVADRGCKLFPVRCFEARNLDLVIADEDGGVQNVLFGEKGAFTYRGVSYEIINVNMAELPYLQCNVIPGRYRAYVVQRVKQPIPPP
jgi:hypothetical protein